MNATAEKYIAGLRQAYMDNGQQEVWEHFEKIKHGLTEADVTSLRKAYPDVPDALVSLLQYADGTYWREYAGEEIAFFFLGSDMEGYPYYLLSSKEMAAGQETTKSWIADYVAREYEEVEMDDRITDKPDTLKWLHFSDCMNNGGTSSLYIDFSPSQKGKWGQVLRFVHDPDAFDVIADSFEGYLEKLMANGYDFINEDVMD